MQPVCTTVSTLCHAGRPQCVSVGNDYGKTRLYSAIRSKTIALLQCAHHHSAQRELPSPPRRGNESAGKRSHINRSSSQERVRLLQPLLPSTQKDGGLRPILDIRLLNYALIKRSFRMITLKQILSQYAQGTGSCRWIWKMRTFTSR